MAWGQTQAQLQRLLTTVEVRDTVEDPGFLGWALGSWWGWKASWRRGQGLSHPCSYPSSCLLRQSEGNEPPSPILARAKLTFLEFCELGVDLGGGGGLLFRAPPSSSLISKERPRGAWGLLHLSPCACPQHRCAWKPLGMFAPLLCLHSAVTGGHWGASEVSHVPLPLPCVAGSLCVCVVGE